MDLTKGYLKEILHYNKDTGVFVWRRNNKNSIRKGNRAGYIKKGYVLIGITVNGKYRQYPAHRLAFLYMTGEIPNEVDHINHKRYDNRWENLRPVSRKMNTRNRKRHKGNKSGFTGVYWNKRLNKWVASITKDYVTIHLGVFDDKEEAVKARKEAEVKFGFHENHGE